MTVGMTLGRPITKMMRLPYNAGMHEVTLALLVLSVATLFGAFLKPNEAQTRPLSPDDIKGHTAEPDHHH
jgi:hypothetical protein